MVSTSVSLTSNVIHVYVDIFTVRDRSIYVWAEEQTRVQS